MEMNTLFSRVRITALFLMPILLFSGCGEQSSGLDQPVAQETATEEQVSVEEPTLPAEEVKEDPVSEAPEEWTPVGSYVGQFEAEEINDAATAMYANRITVFIEEVAGGVARGRSVVAGNYRPWEGEATQDEEGWTIVGREPGDDPYDGVFGFFIADGADELRLGWEANNRQLPVISRSGTLARRDFRYDPEKDLSDMEYYDGLYGTERTVMEDEFEFEVSEALTEAVGTINASTEELTSADVENLYAGDLEVIRNTIYARHGYSFKNRKMRYFFDHFVDWYMPVSVDIRDQLTTLEKNNIELLKRYEEHNERYYDSFGR